jgi:hypothetical protein
MTTVVKLTNTRRVLGGTVGMTFIVDKFSDSPHGPVAHVRDYRYHGGHRPFQVWSVPADDYEVINPEQPQ